MNTDIRDKTCDCHPETCGCAPCELVLDGDVVAWGEREGLARLQARFTSYDIAIGQAVAFAQYVEDHAKGTMADAARKYLSMPFAQQFAEVLKLLDSINPLVRELDVALNGSDGAARQAALCDIVSQVRAVASEHGPVLTQFKILLARVAEFEQDRMHAGVDICEVAAAVEVVRVMEIVKEVTGVVANLHEGPFRHGFEAACEEIEHRLRPCERCGDTAKDGAPC